MSNDVLITPASRKIEFKDSSANVDAKIETDASGNLLITNAGGDISIGDTTSDIFVGDGTNNIDIVFEQDGEIRGTSGVTVTLGAADSNIRMATDLNLNSNDITNVNDITISGNLTVNGTTTTISSVNTTIADSLIELNSGLTGANTKDIGFIFERGSTGNNAAFFWDESSDRFRFITTTNTGSATSIADNISEGTIQAGSFIGNGSQLSSLNASNLGSGTVPSARLSLSASDIPSLAASKITSGTFADARIPNLAGSKITSGTIDTARLPNPIHLSGANAILKLQETDVTNSPTWWHVADGGNYSIRLNNTGTYPISISTDSDNDLVTLINLGYGVSITGDLTVSGNGFFNGTKLEGDSKEMIRYSDAWLRLNPDNDFTSGIYAGTGTFRTDGTFQVGASGTKFAVNGSNGNVTLAGTVDGRDIAADGTKLDTIDTNADVTPSWVPSSNPNYLTGNQTITLSGDVSGSGTTSIAVTVDNYILNDQYATVGSRYSGNGSDLSSPSKASIRLWDVSEGNDEPSGASDGLVYTAGWDSTSWAVQQFHDFHSNDFYLRSKQNGTWMSTWDRVFHDTYHPNADTWTTARTITLGGDLSGSVSINGSANVTLTATVADDSHNHVISNVDGLQSALDAKMPTAGGIFTGSVTIRQSGTPVLILNDNGNAGGGGASGKILFSNTGGNAMGIGYTGNSTADSDMIISTNAAGTYGGYLSLDANGITDASADIILEPKGSVRIAGSGDLRMGTTQVITSAGNWVGGGNISEFTNNSGYITGNQTITLSGDVSGSGTTSIAVTIADDSHNHVISNVDGLQTALDAKLTSSSGLNASNLTSGTVPAARISHITFDVGDTTAETGRTVKETGLYTYNVMNNNLGSGTDTSYYSVLTYGQGTGGSAQIATQWTSNGNKIYFRSLRDTTDNWWSWKEFYHTGHKPTYTELGTMAYSNLTGTPTIPTNNNQLTNGAGYATETYVGTQISNLVDSAPSTLDTLNELAAALGDDANFSTTVTNSIATKLPLAGGTMTGALNMGSQNITNAGTISSGAITATQLNINSGTTNTCATFDSSDDKAFIIIRDDDTDAYLITKDGNFSIGNTSSDYDNFKVNLSNGNTVIDGTITSGQITATKIHAGGDSTSYSDGNDPDISTDDIFATVKVVSPKIVWLNDASGDDNYVTCDDNNSAYTVKGQSAGAWWKWYGDKSLGFAGHRFDYWKGNGAELTGFIQFTGTGTDTNTGGYIYFGNATTYKINPNQQSVFAPGSTTSSTTRKGIKFYHGQGPEPVIWYHATGTGAGMLKIYSSNVGVGDMFALDATNGDGHFKGDVTAYSTTTTSDIKLKENVRDLEGALDTTLKLRGVKFDWKDENKDNDQLGFIAQEVEEVLPEIVKEVTSLGENDETHKSVNYSAVVPILVEAIKEQQTIINRLEERLNNLENKGEE